MRAERAFPADPRSVPAARSFALDALADATLDVRQSVELMVSELATNCVRHGQTSFDLVIERTGDEIRVEVADHGEGTPRMRFPGPDEPTGRGLQIVDMLSERWGVEQESDRGKTVWFTLSSRAVESQREGMAGRRLSPGGRAWASSERGACTFLAPALD